MSQAKFYKRIPHQNTDWKQQAACLDAPPEIFFPIAEGDTQAARQYCDNCPVQEQCAEYGLGQNYGIWGGLTPSQRARRRHKTCPNGHPYKTHGAAYRDGKGNMALRCLECARLRSHKWRQKKRATT